MKPKIWRLNRLQIEEIVKKEFTNLRWCPAGEPHDYCYRVKFGEYRPEKIGCVLYARPKDYAGEISDYETAVVKEIKSKNWDKVRGYRWLDSA